MAGVVENYIFNNTNRRISINLMQVINDERQINMLIDAYNHVKKEHSNV